MPNLLNFTVSKQRFAVDLDRTVKVVPLMSLQSVPKVDPCVVGVMNLGGASIPVIDLAVRLDLAEKRPYTLATSIVVCLRGGRPYGVVADTVDGVERVADGALELDDVLHAEAMPYLGVCRSRRGHQVLVLDLDKVLNLDFRVDPLPSDGKAAAPAGEDAR